MDFSLADFFFNELKWQAGPSDPIGLAPELVALVTSGVASPGFIISDVISIEDAPDAYRRFERHEIVKAVIAFD
jgi:threonine dehydrogenase-like Zn-dependent dehydrogenase